MDLAAGGGRVIVLMYQCDREGRSKLVPELTYPATALGCVREIVTDLAWISVTPQGFVLREVAPGLGVRDVQAACAAPLAVAPDVREMQW
jgi:3-oxoacid CoA-transferase subunit B